MSYINKSIPVPYFHTINQYPSLISPQLNLLQKYDWPGNVRELQNMIERAVITSQGGALQFILPHEEGFGDSIQATTIGMASNDKWEVVPESEMKRRERRNILAALKKSNWKIYGPGGAAQLLGIKSTTLSSRIKKMEIKDRLYKT